MPKPWELNWAGAASGGPSAAVPEPAAPTKSPQGVKPWEIDWSKAIPLGPAKSQSGERKPTFTGGEEYFTAPKGTEIPMPSRPGLSLPWYDRVALAGMDNKAERAAYLEKRYGRDNVLPDFKGGFNVRLPNGDVAPAETGMLSGFLAESPELVGMSEGAILGAPFGPAGAILGAGLGAGTAKIMEESAKSAEGLERKSPAEQTRQTAKTAGFGMIGEGAGRPAAALVSRMLKGRIPPVLSGATPETEDMTALSLRAGGAPPIRSALPDMKVTQFHQALGTKLTGDLLQARNSVAVQNEMRRIFTSSGMTGPEAEEAMRIVTDIGAEPSTKELGLKLGRYAQAHAEGLRSQVEALVKSANENMDRQFSDLRLKVRAARSGGIDTVAQETADALVSARHDFGRAAGKIYAKVDELVGDEPIVPTASVVREAKHLLSRMPESDIKAIVKEIADMKPLESFSNMQRLRTRLFELGEPSDLAAKGLIKRDLRNLAKQVNASFDRAVIGNSPRAMKMLRMADSFWREGIGKFNDATINRLVSAVQSGMPPDASKISETIFRRGFGAKAAQIMGMLPEGLRDKVRGQYFRDLISRVSDPDTKVIDGAKLRSLLDREGNLIDAAFGSKTANELREFAKARAAANDKFPVDLLQPGRLRESIAAAKKARESFDAFMHNNYLSQLASPGMPPDQIYGWLVRPVHETELESALQFFGPGSDQVSSLRKFALIDLMRRAVRDIGTGAGKTIGADALDRVLSGYTTKQQEMLFPSGLADDLKTLAKMSRFLFPSSGKEMAAGLAAGAIKSALPFGAVGAGLGVRGSGVLAGSAIAAYGWGALWNWALSRPNTVRYLALGLDSGGSVRNATIELMRNVWRAGALGMIPSAAEPELGQ